MIFIIHETCLTAIIILFLFIVVNFRDAYNYVRIFVIRCDLAGSERLKKSGVSGDRLKEAKYINSSLLELG